MRRDSRCAGVGLSIAVRDMGALQGELANAGADLVKDDERVLVAAADAGGSVIEFVPESA